MARVFNRCGYMVIVREFEPQPPCEVDMLAQFFTWVFSGPNVIITNSDTTDSITLVTTEVEDIDGVLVGNQAAVDAYFTLEVQKEIVPPPEPVFPPIDIDGFDNNYDAAGALRVSQKTVLGSYLQDKDELPDFIDRVSGGSGSQLYVPEQVNMTVTGGTDFAVAQTYKRHLYLAGFSQSPTFTFIGFGVQASVTKRIGYFSSSTASPYSATLDGFFLEADGTTHNIVIYKNGSLISSIPRASWNDPMDGTGPSGVSIDFNNFTVVEWQFLYLGGTGLEMRFNVGGTIYLAHVYKNSSFNAGTLIGSPVQPIRYEIRSNGGAGTMGQVCSGVSTGGALDIVGYPRSIGTAIGTFINANSTGTQYLIAGIRLSNRRAVGFDISGTSMGLTNDPYTLRLILNPTYDDVTPTWSALGNSNFEVSVGDTTGVNNNTVVGGAVLATSFVSDRVRSGALKANSLFQPGSDLNGVYDEIVLIVEPSSSNLDIKGAINFKTL